MTKDKLNNVVVDWGVLAQMLNTEDWNRRNYLRSLGGRKTPAEYEELQELEVRDYKAPKEND